MDEVALYPKALTAVQIGAHYQRASTVVTSTRRYLLGGALETSSTGTITSFPVAGPEGDLARYPSYPRATLNPGYLYYSGHGDLAAEANHLGTRQALYSYDPFGSVNQATLPGNTTAERYTGRWNKQHDTSSGLIEMGARPYDPLLGRFLAVDPIVGGALSDYDYALQDPINAYDLDGECVPACVAPIVAVPGLGQVVAVGVGVAAVGYGGYKLYKATKDGGSGKPRTHNKRFKSKKEAKEAARRRTARNQQPDHDTRDPFGPHYHAKTKSGKRKTEPQVHYKYPPYRTGR